LVLLVIETDISQRTFVKFSVKASNQNTERSSKMTF